MQWECKEELRAGRGAGSGNGGQGVLVFVPWCADFLGPAFGNLVNDTLLLHEHFQTPNTDAETDSWAGAIDMAKELSEVGLKIKSLESERNSAKEALMEAIRNKEATCPFEVLLESATAELNCLSKEKESLKEELKKGEPAIPDTTEFKATVSFSDDEKDFLILQTTEDVCENPPTLAGPHQGEDYIQFGFSALSQINDPLEVTTGVFTSTEYMARTHHFLGSADSLAITGEITLSSLGSRFPSRAHIVPSAFFI
ncbi:hypothetical protein CcCBS67573_g08762 [Chytriomyces confervae]|uniref:Uncharacterized protein n=1 Tax=Chytriomyces confervae TaxID=246404 RepID=A0A507EIA1_9FUNG|nr:hypothetical protein CcCBS67573_g08762 [Chytriomyces confervae]